MNAGLSEYAQSHMVMVAISQRFEEVVSRHPHRMEIQMRWRIDLAREIGREQRNSFPRMLQFFDYYVHGKPFT